ncbi:MAG TPA: DUF929 family protein [Acidimicrobiales bacterium]|nr:DUF929 family protein [Acidimicrobiales bacterium]
MLAAVAAASIVHALVYGPGKGVAPKLTPASPTVLQEIRSVTPAEQDAVGLPPSASVPFVAKREPSLRLEGRPAALYIGAEFCPDCAATRWAMVMAFDRFGAFSGLHETTSSPWDDDPSTPTFSFYGSRYESPYLSLVTVEREGNDTHGLGTRTNLQPLTALESQLWARYDARFGLPESFPFLDIGNEVFVLDSSYDPRALAGLDQQEVAAALSRSSSSIARDIIGAANYLTAAICQLTHGRPMEVCTVGAVHTAATVLGLG